MCADDKQAGIVGHMETVVCVCRRQTSRNSWSYGNSGVCVQMTNKQEQLVFSGVCVQMTNKEEELVFSNMCADDKQGRTVSHTDTVVCVCRRKSWD